jgi:hypothetical protein
MSTATQPIGVIARVLDLSERRVQQPSLACSDWSGLIVSA